jgi:hypothetical protein
MNAIEALKLWAKLGRLQRIARPKHRANWKGMRDLIDAARPKLLADGDELRRLLEKSRRLLDPFGDPFDIDLGMHRWLADDREEAYSDWLQWILGQLQSPIFVYKLLSLEPPSGLDMWGVAPIIERERFVPKGHEGHSGRLDLVIRYANHALIVIEVKKGSADDADTLKQDGYAKWIGQQPEPEKHSILLVTDGDEEVSHNFMVRRWCQICVFLRQLAARRPKGLSHTSIALMLAFVGAVEQNLLDMSASHIRRVAKGAELHSPQVVDHLKTALREVAE